MTDVGSPVLDTWSARKVRPIVVVYLLGVFAVFIAVAHFVFHSPEAVKALLLTAVGAVVATLPAVLERIEYRATETGIEKRPVKKQGQAEYTTLFRWDELERVVPTRHGFTFYKAVDETGALRRFLRAHFSDRFSGEVHAGRDDVERVLEQVASHARG
jgi:hypothetical protein